MGKTVNKIVQKGNPSYHERSIEGFVVSGTVDFQDVGDPSIQIKCECDSEKQARKIYDYLLLVFPHSSSFAIHKHTVNGLVHSSVSDELSQSS